MKTKRQIAREWLAAQEGPKWMSEIISAMREQGIIMRSSAIAEMVENGQVIKSFDAKGVACYVIGTVPGYYSPEQIAARKERRKEYERERSRRKVKARQEARLAAGMPLSKRGGKRKPAKLVLATSHATVGGESVAEYLARGGTIEHLPGLKKSETFPQRRPSWSTYKSMGQ